MTYNKLKLIIFVILILIGIFIFSAEKTPKSAPSVVSDNAIVTTGNEIKGIEASYVSDKNVEASVTYYSNKTASLDRLGTTTDRVMFDLAISASGARYENKELGLVLWEKAPEINIYKNDKLIFSGRKTEVVQDEKQKKILTSGVWIWNKTLDGTGPDANKGGEILPKKTNAFTLSFTNDGKVVGKTDCNSFSGTYEFSSGKISFGPLASTLMYCEGSQEGDFIKMLTNSTSSQAYLDDSKNQLILENTVTINFFRKK